MRFKLTLDELAAYKLVEAGFGISINQIRLSKKEMSPAARLFADMLAHSLVSENASL